MNSIKKERSVLNFLSYLISSTKKTQFVSVKIQGPAFAVPIYEQAGKSESEKLKC